MRNITAIARREILSFFVSPIAYFVITGFVLLSGYFFFNLLAIFNLAMDRYRMMPYGDAPNLNQWVVEGYFQTLVVVLVFLVPLLTMRMIAEEKRTGTFELLVTSPLSVFEIVLGKFLGVSFVIVTMMLLMFLFPALLIVFGDPGPEVAPMLSGLLGMVLIGLAFSSIGMAVSCFTENQVVAAVCSMVTLLLFYLIQSPAQSLGGGIAADVLNYLSPVMQLRDLMRGVITLKSTVYLLTVISLGIFLSQRALEAYRWR
jgi:ABC-2 type transport system permease protein